MRNTIKLTAIPNHPSHINRLPVFLDIMYPKYPHTRQRLEKIAEENPDLPMGFVEEVLIS